MNRRDFLKFWPALAATIALPVGANDLEELVLPVVPMAGKFLIGATAHGQLLPGENGIAWIYTKDKPLVVIPLFMGQHTERDLVYEFMMPKLADSSELSVRSTHPCVVVARVAQESKTYDELLSYPVEDILLTSDGGWRPEHSNFLTRSIA